MMKGLVSRIRPELLGGLCAVLLAGLLFAIGDTPALIDQLANYPNPFDSRREETFITYRLPQDYPVRVKIYDLFGYQVKEFRFYPGEMGGREGVNSIRWDGSNESGDKVSKGGYICRVTVEGDRPVNGVRKIGVVR